MKKILLLDDNRDFLDMMELILSSRYEIRSVTNCAGAEEMIDAFQPDLVILDYSFPAEDIGRLVERKEAFSKAIPFILCSAIDDIRVKAAEMGANGYISKPCSISGIRKYIDDHFKYRVRD